MNHLLTFKPSPLFHDQFAYLVEQVDNQPELIDRFLTDAFNTYFCRSYSIARLKAFYTQSYELNMRKIQWLDAQREKFGDPEGVSAWDVESDDSEDDEYCDEDEGDEVEEDSNEPEIRISRFTENLEEYAEQVLRRRKAPKEKANTKTNETPEEKDCPANSHIPLEKTAQTSEQDHTLKRLTSLLAHLSRRLRHGLASLLRKTSPLTEEQVRWILKATRGLPDKGKIDQKVLDGFEWRFDPATKYGLRVSQLRFDISRGILKLAGVLDGGGK